MIDPLLKCFRAGRCPVPGFIPISKSRVAIALSRDPRPHRVNSFCECQSFHCRFLRPRLSSQLFFRAVPQHHFHIFALALAIAFTMRADSTFTNAKVGASGCVWLHAEDGEDLDPGHGTAEAERDDSGLLEGFQKEGSGVWKRSWWFDEGR